MTDDLVKRVDSLVVLLNMERKKSLSLGKHIEKLEAALTHIYAWYPISIADPHQTIEEIRKFARNSLEGEDD